MCLQKDPVTAAWFGGLMSDRICLHVILYATEGFFKSRPGEDRSYLELLHYAEALRLLRERLSVPEDELCISDSTIMVVLTLAGAAEFTGDREAAMNHRDGFSRMVSLRGGLEAMKGYEGAMRIKVCKSVTTQLAY